MIATYCEIHKRNFDIRGYKTHVQWHNKTRAKGSMPFKIWSDGYNALHYWVRKRLPKPLFCQDCGKVPPRDLANISQKYLRDLSDWEWLCRSCHMKKDGRIKNLKYQN